MCETPEKRDLTGRDRDDREQENGRWRQIRLAQAGVLGFIGVPLCEDNRTYQVHGSEVASIFHSRLTTVKLFGEDLLFLLEQTTWTWPRARAPHPWRELRMVSVDYSLRVPLCVCLFEICVKMTAVHGHVV